MLFFDNPRRRRRSRRARRNPASASTKAARRALRERGRIAADWQRQLAAAVVPKSASQSLKERLLAKFGHQRRKNRKGGVVARRRRRKGLRRRLGGAVRRARGWSRKHTLAIFGGGRARFVRRRYGTRGRTVWAPNPGNIVAIIKGGVKDGAVILASQIATKKAIEYASRVVPVGGVAGAAITGLGVPVIIALITRKVAPNYARLATAAAFAEGLKPIIAVTPLGPYLGDIVDANYQSQEYSAWPAPQIPAQMGAYPGGGLGDAEYEYVQ